MKLSMKLKFSIVLVALLLLTVFVLSQLVLQGIKLDQRQRLEAELASQAKIASQYVRQNYVTGEERLAPESFLNQRGQRLAQYVAMLTGRQVRLYDATGKEAGNSLPPQASRSDADIGDTLRFALQGRIAYQTSGSSMIYFSPIQVDEQLLGVVRFDVSLRSEQAFLETIRGLFRTAGLIVVVSGFVLGYLYFYRLAAVIKKLQHAAGHIREGRFLREPPVRRKDELGALGHDIFYMSSAIEANIRGMEEEQRKLKLAVDKLQALDGQQKLFISNISHEFKTPLTSIKAYVDLLDMYRDDPALIGDAVTSIRKETERLIDMVEKVLQLAALEKYDFELQTERVELNELLDDICGRMGGKAARFGVDVRTRLQPVPVWADRESLVHIFLNLLDNAIKYNVPGGSVDIAAWTNGSDAVVEIRDTGVGIPEEAREKVFEPFYTVNKDRSRESGGTGLGLPLVKRLVESQGGTIGIASNGSGGTVVFVKLPLYRP